ncbi:MAG: tryptophan--tRNA ligase [Candidatus Kerfeldbacteria bacterium]|nr:tryptophan--tRNA ligase [Candidatus Kerfeldbacteria bacterium]
MKTIVFSGIQPSGQLHIGNYYGAIRSWLELQDNKQNECVFAIVDYHALTEGPKALELEQRIFDTTVDFLAAGLDPKRSTIMLQSLVPEHTELGWILNCVTPVSWLERVPTFKDKASQFKDNINMGLLDYPVLMAADILLYHATLVPVGQDQLAHLELAREIARAFNKRYGNLLPEPLPKVTPTPKIMSLTDPAHKMSKSLGPKAYLALSDEPDTIRKKIKSAVTATGTEKDMMRLFLKRNKEVHTEFNDIKSDDMIIRSEQDLMDLQNELGETKFMAYMAYFNIYMLLYLFGEKKDRKQFIDAMQAGEVRFSVFKDILIDRIIANQDLADFRKKRAELIKSPKKVEEILKHGSLQARRRAQKNLLAIKDAIGIA